MQAVTHLYTYKVSYRFPTFLIYVIWGLAFCKIILTGENVKMLKSE